MLSINDHIYCMVPFYAGVAAPLMLAGATKYVKQIRISKTISNSNIDFTSLSICCKIMTYIKDKAEDILFLFRSTGVQAYTSTSRFGPSILQSQDSGPDEI